MKKLIVCTSIRAVLSILAATGITGAATAQEPNQPVRADSAATDSTAPARAKPQTLKPVRIDERRERAPYAPRHSRSGTKSPALPRDVPQSITVVSRELMRDQGMQGVADVVRYMPGISIGQGEGNRDQVTIRGNSSTADFFVDGVRDDFQYFRDVYNLESVEALKGSNAMIFGRGGGGGVLNRVTKAPDWNAHRDVTLEGGSFNKRRATIDLRQSFSTIAAARLNSVYENSGSFRDGVSLSRSGLNPTLSLASTSRKTRVDAGYEYFRDHRTADRGIPSFHGSPVDVASSVFFGNAHDSYSNAIVNSASATVSHDAGRVQLRNHSRFASYDKVYQNVFPGAVDTSSQVSISAYRFAVDRSNAFNQTDVNWSLRTGSVRHDALFGAEFGRQGTESFRETGYFGSAGTTSVRVPLSNPLSTAAIAFKQSSTDADHETVALTQSVYMQDLLSLTEKVKLIGGARYERFDVRYRDGRTATRLNRSDRMFSPRGGLLVKPVTDMSLYASYSVSFLPGSGDQFSSLTETTRALRPERFANSEAGFRWDVLDRLAITGALYRLDRTNTRSVDPLDPKRVVQTGAQRSTGVELSASGTVIDGWQIAGGVSRQVAKIVNATSASPAGARVPLVPRTSASVWNRVALSRAFNVAVGAVHQGKSFAAIDNAVTLPSFNRIDAAIFAGPVAGLRAQLNVENLFDTKSFPTAHSNNNISPGSPRAFRLSVGAEF